MHPAQRCTIAFYLQAMRCMSVNPCWRTCGPAARSMFEMLPSSNWEDNPSWPAARSRTAEELRQTGSAGKIGERYIGLVGFSDPYSNNKMMAWRKKRTLMGKVCC